MKREINVFEYAGEIAAALQKGILLTTKCDDKVNTMTIGWGMLGIEWNRPIFIALVRENRYTRQMLDQSGDFTVNIPYGEFDKKILGYCGTYSGKDVDKIKELNLTLEESISVSAPGIKELPLTLECKVLYRQEQDLTSLPEDIRKRFYPENVDSTNPGSNKDYHIAYYAEVVKAYIIEE